MWREEGWGWHLEMLVANNPILFNCLTCSVLCAEHLQARLGPGLAVCSLLAGQVVGSAALSCVAGVKGGEVLTVYSANTA